ncbi:Uncharacterised protein [uncultured archaeon]|nr:Uncharacterised protein [uncultured archaeon]
MRIATIVFLLLAFSSFFAASCSPGYEENATIQVIDGMGRPIPNATVQITYQVDQTTGKGYATTAPRYTDSNGIAAFTFRNQEVLQDRVDCEYTIIVTYDNKKAVQKATVNEHGAIITVALDVFALNIQAVDQNGNALSGAEITAGGVKKAAGDDGKATVLLGSGRVNVTLKYGQGLVSREIAIQNDTDYYYQVGVYDLLLHVVDDRNAPLVVNATIGGKTFQTDENGTVSVKKLLTAKPAIKTNYRGLERSLDADLAVQDEYYLVYDLHAPMISNMVASEDQGRIALDMTVIDEGLRASGLAQDGIKVRYSFANTDYVAPVFVKAKDRYETLLGNIGSNGIVEIFVEAKDAEGNIRDLRGYFSVVYVNETT